MKTLLLSLLFFMFSSIVFSQEKIVDVQIDTLKIVQKNFDKEVLDAYKKEAVFNYEIQKREKNIFERAWSWLGRVFIKALSWIFEDIGPAVGLFKAVLQVVPYLILGLLLFFILKFFLKINSKTSFEGNEINPSIFAADEEDLLRHSNIEELITEAIEKNELRLAIRFYYLLVLQKLTEKELIVWQQEKTNEEYVKEVKKASIKEDFKETTHLYDFVWYGNFSMNNTEFLKAEQLFKSLTKKIIG